MAIIQMWPQNQGLRNSVSFGGRTYSSIPGVSIPVPDFDVPVLQANGWTTYATIAGKTTITMLPPAGLTTISFDGRQYSTPPGVSIEVPPFDAMILQVNRWTIVAGALQPLTLSAAAFHVGDPQGTVVATILGASSGSTITFNSLSTAGALQIAGTSLQVGPTPSGAPATVTFNLVETLAGATNTPNQTNGFSVSELVAIPVNKVVPTITGTAQVGQTFTASTGTWTNSPTSYAYQWISSAGGAIPGATASTYVPVAGDIGHTLTVSVVATNPGGSSVSSVSPATSAVAAAGSVPVNTVVPTISGTPQVGQPLTATNGTWTNSPTSFTYQWNRAGTAIGGATASTYVPVSADVGNTLTISVTATNGTGSSTPAASAATSAVIDMVPANLSVPTISGTAQVGQTLTATTGTWTHNPTSFTYQWNRAGGAISGATASTYVPVATDIGNTLTVAVVARNSGGSSAPATSAVTGAVIDMIPANLSVPTISGIAQVGQTLTAAPGTWTHNPNSFTYQWKRAGAAVGGATASTYVPVAADVGNMLTVSVVARNSGGSSAPATSAATGAVIDMIPANLSVPTISGIAQVGQTLTAAPGTWTHNPTSFTYQWKRAGAAVGGATASTYVPVAADVGNMLTVSVVAANTGGSSSPATSAATSSVIDIVPTNSAVPTISGTARVGQTLTAITGTWAHNPTSFTYQWNRVGTAIGGATASAYVPVAADVGSALTVSVVAANSGGSSSPATSSATSSVIDIVPTNSAVPTISGTAQVGQTITATNGTWTNSPTSFTYQWNRAGTPIGGATASSYVPVSADVGNILTLSVTATNGSGSSTPATSAATSSVTGQNYTGGNLLTNTTIYSITNQTKPAYLGSYVDPIFGTKITRISGDVGVAIPTVGGTWSNDTRPGYNNRPVWNADRSLMLIEKTAENSTGGGSGSGVNGWLFLDGNTYAPLFAKNSIPTGSIDLA